jgi:hypothetical protein
LSWPAKSYCVTSCAIPIFWQVLDNKGIAVVF